MILVLAERARAFLDTKELYFTGGGNGLYYGIRSKTIDHRYLLALINSRLLDWLLKSISVPFRGGYYSWGKRYIERLPIVVPDLGSREGKKTHDAIVTLVDRIIDLKRKRTDAGEGQRATVLTRQIDSVEQEINSIVYDLYRISDDERRRIEGAGSGELPDWSRPTRAT